jgi:hypothetical protein
VTLAQANARRYYFRMKTLTLLLLAGSLGSVCAADGTLDVNARLKAPEDKVERLAGQAPPRYAAVDRDRLGNAILAHGREKLEAHKQSEKLTPVQAAQIEKYEKLNLQLLRLDDNLMRQLVRLPPLVVPPLAPPTNDAGKEREELARRVAEAKVPVATIVDRRSHITARYNTGDFLERLIADYVKGRFDHVVNAEPRHNSGGRTIFFRTTVAATDITDELLQFFREREQTEPTPSPAGQAK